MSHLVLALVVLMAAGDAPGSVKADLTFLTRDGCVNTQAMVNNLNEALTALHWPKDYAFIDIGSVPKSDARTGYPTPTLLWDGADIFGMPAPKPPYDVPS